MMRIGKYDQQIYSSFWTAYPDTAVSESQEYRTHEVQTPKQYVSWHWEDLNVVSYVF